MGKPNEMQEIYDNHALLLQTNERLKAQNAELVAALRKCVVLLDNLGGTFIARERAHRLIAKAEMLEETRKANADKERKGASQNDKA